MEEKKKQNPGQSPKAQVRRRLFQSPSTQLETETFVPNTPDVLPGSSSSNNFYPKTHCTLGIALPESPAPANEKCDENSPMCKPKKPEIKKGKFMFAKTNSRPAKMQKAQSSHLQQDSTAVPSTSAQRLSDSESSDEEEPRRKTKLKRVNEQMRQELVFLKRRDRCSTKARLESHLSSRALRIVDNAVFGCHPDSVLEDVVITSVEPHGIEIHRPFSSGHMASIEVKSSRGEDLMTLRQHAAFDLSEERQLAMVLNEIRVLKFVGSHKCIDEPLGIMWDENTPLSVIVLQPGILANSSMIIRSKKYCSKADSRNVFFNILEAMEFLHSKDVCHNTLCPQCLRVFKHAGLLNAVVGGFEYATREAAAHPFTDTQLQIMPKGFIAPEIFQKCNPTKLSDVFSVGCIARYMSPCLSYNSSIISLALGPKSKRPDINDIMSTF